jgi:hypothetical protein
MGYCLLKGCEQRFHPRQARQRFRCGLPGSGAEIVGVEGAAEIPVDNGSHIFGEPRSAQSDTA